MSTLPFTMAQTAYRPDSSSSQVHPSQYRRKAVSSALSMYADSATLPHPSRSGVESPSSYYAEDFLDSSSSREELKEMSDYNARKLEEGGGIGSGRSSKRNSRRLDKLSIDSGRALNPTKEVPEEDPGNRDTLQVWGYAISGPGPGEGGDIGRALGDGYGRQSRLGFESGRVSRNSAGGRGIGGPSAPIRTGFNPWKMLLLSFKGNCRMSWIANCLIPVIPVAIVFRFLKPEWNLWIFITNYLAMIPAANLLSYASGQLADRLPRSLSVVVQVTLASAVELILMILLLFRNEFKVIQAAIIGSVLANLLLVTGTCFVVGGIRYKKQHFDSVVAETGGSLLLISAVGLLIPTAFAKSTPLVLEGTPELDLGDVLGVSRSTSILLIVSYAVFLLFQLKTHEFLFDRILFNAEIKSDDYHDNIQREKLTVWEALFMTTITLALVALHAIFLVEQIHWIVVNRNISDAFMGLILVPLVEKVAEHITAVDEAWDNAMDIALSHVLGSTIQTSLFVAPVVVIVGWIAGRPFDLNFDIYLVVVYFLAVLVVGNFIKDRTSNYLEGALSVIFYAIIATTTFYYPNPPGFEAH